MVTFGYDQQQSAVQRDARQEDALQVGALRTKGGVDLLLAVVADGEGGPGAGEASSLTVRTILNEVSGSRSRSISETLVEAVERANTELLRRKARGQLPTDAVAAATVAAVYRNRLYLAHVGHTRALIVRNRRPFQLTTDDVRGEALTKAVGLTEILRPSTSLRKIGEPNAKKAHWLALRPGDQIVLCSDGLLGRVTGSGWEFISDVEFGEAVQEKGPLEAARRLATFPMSRNGADNLSVAVIRYGEPRVKSRWVWHAAGATVGVGLLAWVLGANLLGAAKSPDIPTPAPDSGVAIIESFGGNVQIIDPQGSAQDVVSAISQLPADYGLQTNVGKAKLILLSARVFVGPGTMVKFRQLESQAPGEENHVVIDLIDGGLLIEHDSSDRLFTVRLASGVEVSLGPGMAGSVAVALSGNGSSDRSLDVACFEGSCDIASAQHVVRLEAGHMWSRFGSQNESETPIDLQTQLRWDTLRRLW